MDRFSKTFNDIDPETNRPFSYGHPDGAWVIAIVFGLITAAMIAFSIISIFTGGERAIFKVVGPIIMSIVLSSVTFFMFRRNLLSLKIAAVLFTLSLVGFIIQAIYNPNQSLVFLVPVLIFGITSLYLYGLQKDKLIK